jgi:hypothetical protein
MLRKNHKYKVSISYSHQNKQWWDWLHRSLETYRMVKGRVPYDESKAIDNNRRVDSNDQDP